MKIEIDDSRFQDLTEKLKSKIIVSSAIQAANRTVGNMKSRAVTFLREDIKIKARDKDRIFQTINASRANNAQAQLIVTPKPVPLFYLKPREKIVDTPAGPRKAVSVVFKGQRKVLRNGFLGETKSGHKGVFQRIGPKRLPIREMFSWIGQDVFKNRDTLLSDLEGHAVERFEFHFISRFKFFLEKEIGKDVETK